MKDLFISYRRDDARADAGRLYDRLAQHLGHDRVFMDVDDIPPGTDFARHLADTLARCDAVLVVIGDQWLKADSATGRSRLHAADDFVRLEVRTALERGVPVVPVLVGGATMPSVDRLPDDLVGLLGRQAVELRHARFSDDVDQLLQSLSRQVDGTGRLLSRRTVVAGLIGAVAIGAGFIGYRTLSGNARTLRSDPARISTEGARAMLVRLGFYDARYNAAGPGTRSRLRQRVAGDDVTVVDYETGLMWHQGGPSGAMVLAGTEQALRRLNESRYAGYSDWRLPTLEEAMSLMRPEATGNYHIDPAFDAGAAPFVWTADPLDADTGWVVYFYDGRCVPENIQFNAYLRAVRSLD